MHEDELRCWQCNTLLMDEYDESQMLCDLCEDEVADQFESEFEAELEYLENKFMFTQNKEDHHMSESTVVFTKDKDTKNTVRFTLQDGPITGSIYVPKDDERANRDTIEVLVRS